MRFTAHLNEERDIDPYEIVRTVYDKAFPFIKEYLKFFRATPNDKFFLSGRRGNKIIDIKPIRNDRYPKDTPPEIHEKFDDMFFSEFGVRYRQSSIFVTGKRSDADSYGDNIYGIFPVGTNYKYIYSPYITDLYSEMVDSGDNSYLGWDVNELAYDIQENGSYDSDELYDEARNIATERFEDSNELDDYKDDDGEFDADAWTVAMDEFVDMEADIILADLALRRAEELIETAEENVEHEIRRYKEGDLKGAINSENEIMLTGSSYIMVREDYLPYVLRYMEVMKSQKPTPERWVEAMRNFDPKKYRAVSGDSDFKRTFKKYINKDLLDMMNDLKK